MKSFQGTVLFFGNFEMPDKNASAHRVLNNGKIFRSLGYNVVFCGIDNNIVQLRDPDSFCDGFQSFPRPYPKNIIQWIKYLFDFGFYKKCFKLFANVKMVILFDFHATPLKKMLTYCHKNGIKVIADVTEWYENRFSFNPIKFIKWYDTRKVMTKLHKKVDGIIVISQCLFDYYKPFVKNMVQIPPLVDIREEIWHHNPKVDSSKIEFVYSGDPGRNKDKIDLIIECFSELSGEYDFLFNVIGVTKEQFINKDTKLIDIVAKLGEKIAFRGRVSHAESIFYLEKADYCIFIRELTRKNMMGFPTKFVECVSSGVGIIANDTSNIKDYFPLDNSWLIGSIDKTAVETAIINALTKGKITHRCSNTFDYHNYYDAFKNFLNGLGE